MRFGIDFWLGSALASLVMAFVPKKYHWAVVIIIFAIAALVFICTFVGDGSVDQNTLRQKMQNL